MARAAAPSGINGDTARIHGVSHGIFLTFKLNRHRLLLRLFLFLSHSPPFIPSGSRKPEKTVIDWEDALVCSASHPFIFSDINLPRRKNNESSN
jgi:hypothetical protein